MKDVLDFWKTMPYPRRKLGQGKGGRKSRAVNLSKKNSQND